MRIGKGDRNDAKYAWVDERFAWRLPGESGHAAVANLRCTAKNKAAEKAASLQQVMYNLFSARMNRRYRRQPLSQTGAW